MTFNFSAGRGNLDELLFYLTLTMLGKLRKMSKLHNLNIPLLYVERYLRR